LNSASHENRAASIASIVAWMRATACGTPALRHGGDPSPLTMPLA